MDSSLGPLRRWARRAARGGFALCATIVISLAWFAGLPFAAGDRARRKRWRDRILRGWCSAMLRAMHVRVTVRGAPPAGPCFLVANHLGYIDVFVIGAQADCVFVSMAELANWPLIGFMARQMGTLFIDRSRKREIPLVNSRIEAAFAGGHVVVIFPEGRHSPGDAMLPFRPALLEPAARSARPVAWATIHYSTAPGDPPAASVIPWIKVPLVPHVLRLLALERIDATITFGEGFVRNDDRKQLIGELRARIETEFRPLAPPRAAAM
jgi:1-acyl-sn-glycerol-3-phosphate acyltransferase